MWSKVRRGVLEVQVWLTASAYFGILSGLYSFGLFVSWPFNYCKNAQHLLTTASSCQLLLKTLDSPRMPIKYSCGL